MPFAFFVVGIVFVAAAVRGKQTQLFSLLKGDVTGSGNFLYWIVSLAIIGALGKIPRLKPISDAFIVLLLIVLVIGAGKNGLFGKFNDQLREASDMAAAEPTPSVPAQNEAVPVPSLIPGLPATTVQPGTTPWAGTLPASP